jgi:hypothetical protein
MLEAAAKKEIYWKLSREVKIGSPSYQRFRAVRSMELQSWVPKVCDEKRSYLALDVDLSKGSRLRDMEDGSSLSSQKAYIPVAFFE